MHSTITDISERSPAYPKESSGGAWLQAAILNAPDLPLKKLCWSLTPGSPTWCFLAYPEESLVEPDFSHTYPEEGPGLEPNSSHTLCFFSLPWRKPWWSQTPGTHTWCSLAYPEESPRGAWLYTWNGLAYSEESPDGAWLQAIHTWYYSAYPEEKLMESDSRQPYLMLVSLPWRKPWWTLTPAIHDAF